MESNFPMFRLENVSLTETNGSPTNATIDCWHPPGFTGDHIVYSGMGHPSVIAVFLSSVVILWIGCPLASHLFGAALSRAGYDILLFNIASWINRWYATTFGMTWIVPMAVR